MLPSKGTESAYYRNLMNCKIVPRKYYFHFTFLFRWKEIKSWENVINNLLINNIFKINSQRNTVLSYIEYSFVTIFLSWSLRIQCVHKIWKSNMCLHYFILHWKMDYTQLVTLLFWNLVKIHIFKHDFPPEKRIFLKRIWALVTCHSRLPIRLYESVYMATCSRDFVHLWKNKQISFRFL